MTQELAADDSIGPYLIEEEIGRGGMGVVYRCRDSKLDRPVAVKVMAPELSTDVGVRKRFLREATVVASIDHPNVVPIYDSGESDGRLYLAMRYVDGSNVQVQVERGGPFEPHRAVAIIEQVASALDAAHERGLVHRDVKPANIMLTSLHDREHAYLTDFGLASLATAGSKLTGLGQAVGSVDYMAPEQIQTGTVDARSDTYALGCVAFQMLTGRVPYARDSDIARLWGHVNDPPPMASQINPQLPATVDQVLARAMSKDPADRYATSGQFALALDAALSRSDVREELPEPGSSLHSSATTRPRSRSKLLVAGIGAVAALSVIGGYLLIAQRTPSAAPSAPVPASGSPHASQGTGRAGFTPEYAAAMLNIYFRAISSADVSQICALNASRAPGNPNGLSSSECADRYESAIKDKSAYWKPGQAERWGAMSAQGDHVIVNEKGDFVFDSRAEGFAFASGKPADCASADGCSFVVLYDQGDAYVERGQTSAESPNPL